MKKVPSSENLHASLMDVRVVKALNIYDGITLFPEKLERANATLRRVGMPKGGLE